MANVGKVLRAYKFAQTADLADAKSHQVDVVQSVVVVGEVKRGKSSLVNALLGVRDASPVDVDVTTSASLHYVAESADYPAGSADLVFPGEVRRIPAGELADWVTVGGRRVSDPNTESLPSRAVIPIPSVFPDTEVIDTPGTGGLVSAHAQLAVKSAQQACILVVACDGSTPLTAPEMAFIAEISASVESIIVAVTKTDKNLRRWRPIVEENQRLLQQHLRRQVPVIGISSVRALAALELPPGPARERAELGSGVIELRALIRSRLAMGEHLPAVDGLRIAWGGLRKVQDKITSDLTILREGTAAVPDLTAERDRLQMLQSQSGNWDLNFGRDLTLARHDAMAQLTERLDAIRERWTNRINKSGIEVLRKNPQIFTAEMESELLAAMVETVNGFLARLEGIVNPLFESDVMWSEIEQLVLESMKPPHAISGPQVASKRQGLLDPSMLSMGMVGTSALGALIGIGALAGVVWIGFNLGYKAMKTGKNNLIAWLRETLNITRSTTGAMLEMAIATSRPEIVRRYREHLRTSTEAVKRQLIDASEAARLDAAERDKREKALTNNQRVVLARTTEVENLITSLTTAGDTTHP